MKALPLIVCAALFWTATLAAQDPYGNGTPGSGGLIPRISAPQAWMGNTAFGYTISNALGGAGAFLGISLAESNLNFGSFDLFIDPSPQNLVILAPLTLSGTAGLAGIGSTFLPIPLAGPPQLALAGLNFYVQALVVDALGAGGVAATQGLRLDLTLPPQVFVGVSVGGSTDPWVLADPINGTIVGNGGSTFSDNITGANFAHGGKSLFVGQSIQNAVNHLDLTVTPPVWTRIYTGPGACFDAEWDWKRNFVWTLTGPGPQAFTRDLKCLDADPTSPNFGNLLGTTTLLTNGQGSERWALSRSGNLAAVPGVYLGPGSLFLVDTNPASSTFLQVVASPPVPDATGFVIAAACGFTPNDEYCVILLSGLGAQSVAEYHIPSGTWVDHDQTVPGTQNLQLPFSIPNRMAISRDGSFAVIAGGGGGGWVMKLDFNWLQPENPTITPWLAGSGLLTSANAPSLSSDGSLAAISSTSPPKLLILDTSTGTVVQNISLAGFGNIYTSTWR